PTHLISPIDLVGPHVVEKADMALEMQQDAVACATQAVERHNVEKDLAAFIKREFDEKYNPTWHCVECGKALEESTRECPICRERIARIVRTFNA
ncbi:Dynein light chain 1, cytoplasmic, partial [Thoreauomyces humboldtii]